MKTNPTSTFGWATPLVSVLLSLTLTACGGGSAGGPTSATTATSEIAAASAPPATTTPVVVAPVVVAPVVVQVPTTFNLASATKVADDQGWFTVSADATVYFYASGQVVSKALAVGVYQASTALFGDPMPGAVKAAYAMGTGSVAALDPNTANWLAGQGAPFYLSAPGTVLFGADSRWTSKTLPAGTYTADTATFGSDPAPGVSKTARIVGTASIPQFDASAAQKIADEYGTFTLAYPSIVYFGVGSSFTARLLTPGTYVAGTALFADPAFGTQKAAYVLTTDDQGPRASAPPTITTQPQSVTVRSSAPVTFSVAASSETVIRYQWSRDGVPIAGATASSYSLLVTQLADNGASFSVTVKNNAGSVQAKVAVLTVSATAGQVASAQRPFSDQSPWNSRPTQVTLGTYQIPASYYFPLIGEGDLSVSPSIALATDPPATIVGPSAGSDLYIADAEAFVPQLVIPHWPASVTMASGGDGHADVIDVANNKIHSFYQLRKDGDKWRAAQYTWTALNGRGFSTPGQYFQGSRAAGVVPIAGLVRTSEINDGQPTYKHALAMSLMQEALSGNPTYVFPATAADIYSEITHTGGVPEGALLMLPANFDLSKIKDPKLLKIARTLQLYGGYVVDANTGTPFVVYVELGSGFSLMPNGWDNEIASELDAIRQQLRMVTASSGWVDANGASFTPERNLNLLSLRGGWYVLQGPTAGTFDTWDQAVTFAANGQKTVQLNASGRSMPSSLWAAPVAGKAYRLEVTASGGATLQLTLVDGSGRSQYATADLGNGSVHVFTWPVAGLTPQVKLTSGATGGGKVSATLIAQ